MFARCPLATPGRLAVRKTLVKGRGLPRTHGLSGWNSAENLDRIELAGVVASSEIQVHRHESPRCGSGINSAYSNHLQEGPHKERLTAHHLDALHLGS
jgi:hypothetical protein